MLGTVKLVRKAIRQLKSDLTPTQLAAGAFLGALAGLTPAGLHWGLLLALAFLFNCSVGTFLLAFGVLKPVGLGLAPAAFRLGEALLGGGSPAAAAIVKTLAEAPVLAYLGYDRYVVAGAYAIALPAALVAAAAVGVAARLYRERIARWIGESPAFRRAMQYRAFRALHWVFAGKDPEPAERKPRFILMRPFRAYMPIAVPLLAAAVGVGGGFYAELAVRGLAEGALSRALGVRCTFGDIRYSFFGQTLRFTDFQLPDPSDTGRDMVRIGGFHADLHFTDLLRGRFRIEDLRVEDVSFDVVRHTDGRLNVTELPAAKPSGRASPGERAAWEEFVAWLVERGREADWADLLRRWAAYREKALREREEARKVPPARREPLPYDPSRRWDFERSAPLVRIERIEARGVALRVTDRAAPPGGAAVPAITHLEARGSELSGSPGWNGAPLELEGKGKLDGGASGEIAFRVSILPGRASFDLGVAAVPLPAVRAWYEKTLPVLVEEGVAAAAVSGAVERGTIDASVNLRVDRLRVAARKDRPRILGLDERTSAAALQGVNAYGEKLPVVVGAALVGPVGAPSVQAQAPFLEIARKGLEMLGRRELQEYIDRLDGRLAAVRKAGAEKLVSLEGDFKAVQEQSIKALQTGDVRGLQEALKKTRADAKDAKDVKKEAGSAADSLKNLFKKKE
jgi:uncharacterized protein (TIGR03546 family)